MKIAQMKIGQRLALGFGVAISAMVAVIVFAGAILVSVREGIDVIANERYPQTALANSIKSDLSDTVQAMRDVLLLADAQEVQERVADIEQSMEFAGEALNQLNGKPLLSQKEDGLRQAVAAAHADFVTELDSFKQLARAEERDKARDVLYTRVQTAQMALFQSLNNLIAFHGEAMLATSTTAASDVTHAFVIMAALAGAACLLALAISVLVTRSIVRPLGQAVELAGRVADGDLTASITVARQDETGALVQSLMAMNGSLAGIVADVRGGTDTIGTAAAEIAHGSMDLAVRTEQQAASVERVVAAMDGLTAAVQQNAGHAQQASELAASAAGVAVRGGAEVEQVVATMQSIHEAARKIVDIISVIDGIAFQTNILALNAAVEAARAGEQGRGFAVVASEVRNLAQRSAGAAKEIKALIGDSVERVNAGNRLAGQAGATMAEVVASVNRVAGIIAEISAASGRQSDGIVQVNHAFVQIDEATNQNAALVEEAAAAAERMREEAAMLARAVGIFKLVETVAVAADQGAPALRERDDAAVFREPALITAPV